MVNLRQLAVSQRLLGRMDCIIGIKLEFEIEDVVAKSLGGTKRCEEKGCAQRLGGA
jgi:hypothetical protein